MELYPELPKSPYVELLTDFSVYYTQGAAEAAASLKNGKNEVVFEQEQLIKVSKGKKRHCHPQKPRLGIHLCTPHLHPIRPL